MLLLPRLGKDGIEKMISFFVLDIDIVDEILVTVAFHNPSSTNHQIVCMVNKSYLVELIFTEKEEPYIGNTSKIVENSLSVHPDSIQFHQYCNKVHYLFTKRKMLCIFSENPGFYGIFMYILSERRIEANRS